ncbi:uncharacterized protein LOC124915231 [Impatiens glandulifera]|uniref:uncharacterized protein LOC124915231 n=1 Tax=Impatiens glandulifera TaxID=253017 RepID=UPI001FB07C53|nr:uncharacterized protein LOC124915231 [Impatiens glandulifera]
MEAYLWIRSSLSRPKTTKFPSLAVSGDGKNQSSKVDEEELYGVTTQLIDFVKAFNFDTFRNFPLQDEQEGSSRDSAIPPRNYEKEKKDLSDWQERHASLVLSKVKELSQLRFRLCPRYLKELQFWRIYFKLVKIHVNEYELRAVRAEKLRQMAMGMEDSSNRSSYEVEMAETNQFTSSVPSSAPLEGLDTPSSDIQ